MTIRDKDLIAKLFHTNFLQFAESNQKMQKDMIDCSSKLVLAVEPDIMRNDYGSNTRLSMFK